MTALTRLALFLSGLFALVTAVAAWGYWFYFRPIWTNAETLGRMEAFITDPATPLDRLRFAALDCHRVFIQSHDTIDVVAQNFVLFTGVATLGFGYLAFSLWKLKRRANSAL
jgi:hypothetical protein